MNSDFSFLGQQQYEDIFFLLCQHTHDGIMAYDRDLRYLIWNPVMEVISNCKAADVIGKKAFDIFPFLKDAPEGKAYEAALAGKVSRLNKVMFSIPDSKKRGVVETKHFPFFNQDRTITGAIGIITPVAMDDQLFRDSDPSSHEPCSWNATLSGFIRTNQQGLIEFISEALLRFLKKNAEQVMGKSLSSVFGEGGYLERFKQCTSPFASKFIDEVFLQAPNNQHHHCIIFLYPCGSGSGDDLSFDIYLQSSTDNAMLLHELSKVHEAKRQAVDTLEVMTSTIDAQKSLTQQKVLLNIECNIKPILLRLKNSKNADKTMIDILTKNIESICEDLPHSSASISYKLTPAEIEICHLAKFGYRDKKIAEILNLSPLTVQTHKKNIRRKLGITHKRERLADVIKDL
jgi:DNA-binding CsgD family transcriptional regulator/PAS domain-containing protein